MESINKIIPDVIENISTKTPKIEEKVHEIWKRILNKKELKHTKIKGLKQGDLFVTVDSSTLIFHMNMKKNKILKEINKEVSEINNIVFKIGKIT